MGDNTNTGTAVVPAVKPTETILQEIEDFFSGAEKKTVDAVDSIAHAFDAEAWPYVKHFLGTLLSQTGQAALKAAIGAAPLLATGGFAAAAAEVGTAVVTTVVLDAPLDAQETLQSVQAALQVVKVTNSVVTTGDAPTVAAIQAAIPTK